MAGERGRARAQDRVRAGQAAKAARSHRAELDALIAKVRSGRAEEGDLLKYLELTVPDGDGRLGEEAR